MSVHPAVLRRFKRSRERHKCLGCLRGEPSIPGDETLARELEALDPHGLLSLAESVGPERAARLLEVRVEAVVGEGGG